jgi:lipopolysaccharide cholinephosphotransferase
VIELNKEQLAKLQLVELEILIEIDRICRKNNISYSLTGGTLLGAVRHGGFIPWDDDADISMLRREYIKFQEACKTDLDKERFYFQDIENTLGYRWGYGKVRRKNSIFLRESQEDMPYEQGIFVDVFPRDSVPNNVILRNIHTFYCFTVRKIMWSAVGRKTVKNPLIKKWYALLYTLTKNNIPTVYKRLVKHSGNNKTTYVRALTFPLPNNQVGYKREWYKAYTDIEFEGHTFQVEASYKIWLEKEFGDYMKLPPVEKRKIHPVSRIEFPY